VGEVLLVLLMRLGTIESDQKGGRSLFRSLSPEGVRWNAFKKLIKTKRTRVETNPKLAGEMKDEQWQKKAKCLRGTRKGKKRPSISKSRQHDY